MKKLYQVLFLLCFVFSMTCILGINVHAAENTDPVAMQLDTDYTITPTEVGQNYQYFSFTAEKEGSYVLSTKGNTYNANLENLDTNTGEWYIRTSFSKTQTYYRFYMSSGESFQFRLVTNMDDDSSISPYTLIIQTSIEFDLSNATSIDEEKKITFNASKDQAYTSYTFIPEKSARYLLEFDNDSVENYYGFYDIKNEKYANTSSFANRILCQLEAGTEYLITIETVVRGSENLTLSFQIKDALTVLTADAEELEEVTPYSVDFNTTNNEKVFLLTPSTDKKYGFYFEHSDSLSISGEVYDITDSQLSQYYNYSISLNHLSSTSAASDTFLFEKGKKYLIHIYAYNTAYNSENSSSHYQFNILEEYQLLLKQSNPTTLNQTHDIVITDNQRPSCIYFTFAPEQNGTYTFTSESESLVSIVRYYDITDNVLEDHSNNIRSYLLADRQYLIAIYLNFSDKPSGTYQIKCIESSTPTTLNQTHNIKINQHQEPTQALFTFTPDHNSVYTFDSDEDNLIYDISYYDITDNYPEHTSFGVVGYLQSGRTYLIQVNLNINKPSDTYSIKWIENSSSITLNETQNKKLSHNASSGYAYFTFAPDYKDVYTFNSTEEDLITGMEYWEIIDNELKYLDDSESLLEPGKTYLICIFLNSYNKPVGTYPLTLMSKTERYKEQAEEIELNNEFTVNIEGYGNKKIFSFTPPEDGDYKFFSYSYKKDPEATLYCLNDNNQGIDSSHYDNSGGLKRNFKIIHYLEKGKTYLFVCSSRRRIDDYRCMLVKYSEEYEKGFAYSDSNASVAFGDEYYDEFSQQVSEKTGSSTLADSLKESWTKFWGGFWHGAFGNSSGNASGNASGNSSGNATGNNAGDEGNATGHGLLTSWSNFWSDLWTSLVTQPAQDASGDTPENESHNAFSIVTKLKQAIIAHSAGFEEGNTFKSALEDLKNKFWTSFWNNASDTLTGNTTPKFTWDDSECTVTYGDNTITDVTITSAVISSPTCTATGKTKYTATVVIEGKTYTNDHEVTTKATGHTVVTDPAKEPTCTETGLTEGSHCKVCGTVIVPQQTIKANGHTEVTDPAKAPTCTETGLTEGSHCEICDTVIVPQQTIKANGHTAVTDPAKEPTCINTGLTEGSHCKVCDTVIVPQQTILATGHNWDKGTEENGKMVYTCDTCKNTEEKELVVQDIINQATTVVDTLKDNNEDLSDQEKSTVVQTVNQVIGKIDTASEVNDNIGIDAVASMDELLIKSQNTVKETTPSVGKDCTLNASDITIEGAALTAQKFINELNETEKDENATYNTVININTADSPEVESTPEAATDYVLDISISIVKTLNNKTESVNGDTVIQPAAPIRMTIPVPDEYLGKEFKLYHYKGDERETIDYELSSDGKTMTFVVTSLSPYALAETPTFKWHNDKCTTLVGDTETETQPTVALTEKINPTCAKAGKLVYTASINYRDDPYEDTNEITVPATGQHSWDQGVQNGNVIVHTCTVCKQTKTTAAPVTAPTDAKVTSINITGLSHYVAAGKKMKLTATALPENATNKSVVWSSSNTKVATVNQSGVVSVRKKTGGKSVVITATAADGSGAKQTFKISSRKGVVTKIAISSKKILSASKSMKLKASVKATAGANKKIKWTSSNPAYATVSSKGVVKALKAGKGKTVKITAMATDGSGKKATIKIKIK